MQKLMRELGSLSWPAGIALSAAVAWPDVGHDLLGVPISLAFTPVAVVVASTLALQEVHILFMIPVMVAATRYGLACALASAITAMAASAYFFYAPFYSLAVVSPEDVVSLITFVVVAVIASHLSTMVRAHAAAADRNYRELEGLYAVSRRLARATTPEEFYAAIRNHLTGILGCKVELLFDEDLTGSQAGLHLPEVVLQAMKEPAGAHSALIEDAKSRRCWLLRRLRAGMPGPGYLLVEIDEKDGKPEDARLKIDLLLDDALTTLEQLDLTETLADARVRGQAASLKEAVIGSVSHGLRTPLTSIMGSASVLAAAKPVKADPQLANLIAIILSEASRLNGDIQNLLDAATLSSAGLKPEIVWVEPSDLVAAAVASKEREVAGHTLVREIDEGLAFVKADAALARDALGLLIDNAIRYSPVGKQIRLTAKPHGDMVEFAVEDQGMGFDEAERQRLLEKFYRGARVRETTRGSGLGLWIANSFASACAGRLVIANREGGVGARVSLLLPAACETDVLDSNDDQ